MRHLNAILIFILLLFFAGNALPGSGETVTEGNKVVEEKKAPEVKKETDEKKPVEGKKPAEGKKGTSGKKPAGGKKIAGGKKVDAEKKPIERKKADEKKTGEPVTPRQTVIPREDLESENISVTLIMERYVFFRDEPVPLRISVKNISSSPVSFDIWEKGGSSRPDYITFQPVVFDMNGREAEIIIPYRLENRGIGEIIKEYSRRKIDLGPGEEFIQTIDMRRVYNLVPDRKYRVKGYFIPSLERGRTFSGVNIITFSRSGQSRAPGRYLAREIKHEVSPSEVVLLALDAEKKGNWNMMLKYLDVEKYIHSFSEYVKVYTFADDIERRNIINNFIHFLSRQRDDYLLDYRIFREEYDEERKNAFVNVLVERFGTPKNETYDYRFTLERYRSLWLIVNLEVNVVKRVE